MNKLAKKSIVALGIITVLSWLVSFANQVNQNPEVTAANKLAELWIIVDMSTNPVLYELNKSITRREMLKVMMNLSKIEVWDNCTGKFADLTSFDWWCKYAETALNYGFIAPNELFRPDDNVSKIEALKMILQSRGFSNTDTTQDWREKYVKTAVSQDILSTGFTDYDTVWIRGWIFIVSSKAIYVKTNLETITCVDDPEGRPVITSISSISWKLDQKIEIKWCNFAWFEWDLNIWIENNEWEKWIIYSESWSNSKLINFILKSQICKTDTSYSGLECESYLKLVPWNYKIYVMPWWKISNKISFTIIENSYKSIMDYVDQNITKIMMSNSQIKPVNDKWFADWYGFTSDNHVYVDFEDGHNMYRALIECKNDENIISCNYIAIFEKQDEWRIIQWIDTQKDKPIIYQYAKDYEWKR